MKNIAIIMGGYSSEYKISLISGNVVYQYLDKSKFKAIAFTFSKKNGCMSMSNECRIPNR